MKKSFEYDLTKYDPNAPTRTEQFLTADGAKTLTTDANDGAVLIQDSVDPDSLNPVTAAAVATAVAGASGEVPIIGNDDGGKVLTAVVDGSSKSVEWSDAPSGLPDSTGATQGDVLTIGASGPEWDAPSGGASYTAGKGINIVTEAGLSNPVIAVKTDSSLTVPMRYGSGAGFDYGTYGYMGCTVKYVPGETHLNFSLDGRIYYDSSQGNQTGFLVYNTADKTQYAQYASYYTNPTAGTIGSYGQATYFSLSLDPDYILSEWSFSNGIPNAKKGLNFFTETESLAICFFVKNTSGSAPNGRDYASIPGGSSSTGGAWVYYQSTDYGPMQVTTPVSVTGADTVGKYLGCKATTTQSGTAYITEWQELPLSTTPYVFTGDWSTSSNVSGYGGILCDGIIAKYDGNSIRIPRFRYTSTAWNNGILTYSGGTEVCPFFYKVADHSCYVLSSTTCPATNSGSSQFIGSAVAGQANTYEVNITGALTLDTSHAGNGFTLADLTTSDWALGWHKAEETGGNFPASGYYFVYAGITELALGYTVTVPAFDTTADVGKVLQVTANGLAWVTPS